MSQKVEKKKCWMNFSPVGWFPAVSLATDTYKTHLYIMIGKCQMPVRANHK